MIGDILLGLLGAENLLEPYDRKFSIQQKEIGREERTADGTLVSDIIAVKNVFTLRYETIDQSQLLFFQQLYDLRQKLSLLVYSSDVNYSGYWVIMKPFEQTRLLAVAGGVWEGVTITLDEV
jgi:hypothetical protein